uniref:Glutamine amidotransferase domain-containing protein n=1 Tax=Noctiluca scintillans TaxID=2966 RepID=A0A7S1ABT4_NOCSC
MGNGADRCCAGRVAPSREVVVVDYGAGNVQSVCNAIIALGLRVRRAQEPDDINHAQRIVFPGVGAFGPCIARLHHLSFFEPLKKYIDSGRPFFGICLGMQTLFEYSEESPGVSGLSVFPGTVKKFSNNEGLAVPHMGWSGVAPMQVDPWPFATEPPRYYFVHSYCVPMPNAGQGSWALGCSEYGQRFVCAVRRGHCVATQFHPEKSGSVGLELLGRWLREGPAPASCPAAPKPPPPPSRRVIACLDVRANDEGDLVVTKGDQYDVREGEGDIRNHGKPVELAERYFQEGADEISFLNITAFREVVLKDQPMLTLLRQAAAKIFVPLTVGGGVRGYTDQDGKEYSALDVADAYFRAGADKISIGTDAVEAAEKYYEVGKLDGTSSIERISKKYGRQAVVVSFDPRRVYVANPKDCDHECVEVGQGTNTPLGPNKERFAWYCCTSKGGRQDSKLDVVQLAKAVDALGAGEILLNCIDRDGQKNGFELELIRQVKSVCTLPVIASSGAGSVQDFSTVLLPAAGGGGGADAALAAGIFHRREVPLEAVKEHLAEAGIAVRR